MNANHHQPVILVFFRPCTRVWQRTQAIDAGIGPEIDQDDFAAQGLRRQWWGVEPRGCAGKRRQLTLDRQAASRDAVGMRWRCGANRIDQGLLDL